MELYTIQDILELFPRCTEGNGEETTGHKTKDRKMG